jgi:hypothetical protein
MAAVTTLIFTLLGVGYGVGPTHMILFSKLSRVEQPK